MPTHNEARGDDQELAVAMTSSAGLELFWSAIGAGAALVGIVGPRPLAMSAIAAIAIAFAVLAHGSELAARWPTRPHAPTREAVGLNVLAALAALILGAFAVSGLAAIVLAPLGLLLLAGLLVLDAPLEGLLAARRGTIAGGVMALAGLTAILVLVAGFSARRGVPVLVPWAALVIASAYLIGAASVLLRFARAASSRSA